MKINTPGGLVTVTGSGLKGKAPISNITALGADITINNGAKSAGNISLGGNNLIQAN